MVAAQNRQDRTVTQTARSQTVRRGIGLCIELREGRASAVVDDGVTVSVLQRRTREHPTQRPAIA